MNIGIFDSGCGGISIINQLIKHNIHANIFYYADSINVPWGTKSKLELKIILNKISSWFQLHNTDIIICGCNTSYGLFKNDLKSIFSQPVLNILDNTQPFYTQKNYSVLATENTIKNQTFCTLLPTKNIQELPCPDLATLIEKNQLNNAIKSIKKTIATATYSNIILGCTHYPLLIDALNKTQHNHTFIDPSNFFVLTEEFKEQITKKTSNTNYNFTFKVSGNTELFNQLIKQHLKLTTIKTAFPKINMCLAPPKKNS
jgi:glutamate racemase